MVKKTKRDPWKSKVWYSILTPEIFGSKVIGETPADDANNLYGRIIEASLKEITGNFRKYYVKLFFKINEVSGTEAKTNFIGHDLTRDYIQSIVRRLTSRVDDTVDVKTQDNAKIRIKSTVFTRRRVNSSKKAELRKKMTELISNQAVKSKMSDLVDGMIQGKLSTELYEVTKKICPINRAEIRKSEVFEQAS